ncbi:MAG TPA: YkvA family protein [Vicinamibacteria bacterium]|nr:YkvA family protein [Vicinamibacteria bacterium]
MRERWRTEARRLKREVYALYLACRDRRSPWYAKVLAAGIVAYALSPIDLIPDFIPFLGYLDDLVLLPLGVRAVRGLIPPAVMEDCRLRADEAFRTGEPVSRVGAAIVIGIWLLVAVGGVALALRLLQPAH